MPKVNAQAKQLKPSRSNAHHPASAGNTLPAVQRKMSTTKEAVTFERPVDAFVALKKRYPDIAQSRLFDVLQELDNSNPVYGDMEELDAAVRKLALEKNANDIGDIQQVMEHKSLPDFIRAQESFQTRMENMNGMQSAGFEFEFASFTATPQTAYTQVELIPSHQLMAKSANMGNFFKLGWRLESDALNTLELVTPPFVFPRTTEGKERVDNVKEELKEYTQQVINEAKGGGLSAATTALETRNMGRAWDIKGAYRGYGVIPKEKGGAAVYAQKNISLYAHEVGALLQEKFHATEKTPYQGALPQTISEKVRFAFEIAGKSDTPVPVTHAINVFARYASNAISIPSMRYRQTHGERYDHLPTDVKDTFDVWVKTDALNLLKDLLKEDYDIDLFCKVLTGAAEKITQIYIEQGIQMVRKEAEAPLPEAPKMTAIDVGNYKLLGIAATDMRAHHSAGFNQNAIIARTRKAKEMETFVALMVQEVKAFIARALAVREHVHTHPKHVTKDFLKEEYGSGEGVRKGTYLRSVPSDQGNQYVTERR